MEQSVRIIWHVGICHLQKSFFQSCAVAGYGQRVDRAVHADFSGNVTAKVTEYLLEERLGVTYV